MENRYKINYDMKTKSINNIKFKQGDIDSSVLEVSLIDGSLPINITGEVIEFRFLKSDKTVVYQDISTGVSIVDALTGKIQCVLKSNTLSASGIVKCEVYRTLEGKGLTTPSFHFTVEASIGADGTLSINYISSIETKLIEFDVIKSEYDLSLHENTDIEIVNARTGEVDLGTKIGKIDASLANKANQVDLTNGLGLKRSTSVKLNATNDFDDATKTMMTGTTPITYSTIPAQSTLYYDRLMFPDSNLLGDESITINFQTKTISFATNVYIVNDDVTRTFTGKLPIDITSYNYAIGTHALIYNFTSSAFEVYVIGSMPVTRKLIVFYFYADMVVIKNRNAIKIINSSGIEATVKLPYQHGRIYNDNSILIDSVTQKVSFSVNYILYRGSYATPLATADFDLTTIANWSVLSIVCYYNKLDNKIYVDLLSNLPAINTYILFVYYAPISTLITESPRSVNVKLPDGTLRTDSEPTYDEVTNRLLLPPKMFFVDTETLPIYKSNIFADNSRNLNTFKTTLINVDVNNKPKYQYFDEDILLNPTELQDIFTVGVKQYQNPSYNYMGNITKTLVTSTSNTGKTPKIINIGDSLTNRNIPPYLKTKLATYGVTATMQGTMNNTGAQGEGREGWEFENFIGMDNTYDVTPITRQTTAGVGSLTTNPFLKLADSNDITNNPTWCFRNTGSNQELSYFSDTVKTGDFYIFDFNYYLTTQGFTLPDVVTLALSTNDILQDSIDALAQSRLALEIMIKQIKIACPICKIGVVPAPSWGSIVAGSTKWNTYVAPWLENCMTDILTYQATITGLDIVPVWCHLNRDFNFPYSATVNLSSVNQTKKVTRTEYVHFGETGKVEYINVLSAYVMNVI